MCIPVSKNNDKEQCNIILIYQTSTSINVHKTEKLINPKKLAIYDIKQEETSVGCALKHDALTSCMTIINS